MEVTLEPAGQPPTGLADLPTVNTMVKVGDKWRLYTDDPSILLPQMMRYAEAHHLRVVSLNTLAPSLEDVFLEITGQQVGTMQSAKEPPRKRRGKGGKR